MSWCRHLPPPPAPRLSPWIGILGQLLGVEGQDLLELLGVNDKRRVREAIVELILVTDLSIQGNFLKEWATKRHTRGDEGDEKPTEVWYDLDLQGRGEQAFLDRLTLFKLVTKAADVSNPAKDFKPYLRWTSLIINEFYEQVIFQIFFFF